MRLTLLQKILIVVALVASASSTPVFLLSAFTLPQKIAMWLALVIVSVALARVLLRNIKEGLSALELGLLNLKDGEYSTTLAYDKNDELGDLCTLYNDTANQLREEKHGLHQRELLLDKVTQSSPEVLFLLNDHQQVIFSNLAARDFFNRYKTPNTAFGDANANVDVGSSGQSSAFSVLQIDGAQIEDLLESAPKGAHSAIREKREGLFTIQGQGAVSEAQTWHMSTGKFLLNNQHHTLFILKQMTRELSRQEVSVWKKVIRVISHELNNSLGPISSMLHSGKILGEKSQEPRLNRVFDTIDERIKHLSEFVQGYGKFAKLPAPKIQSLDWQDILSQLSHQWEFTFDAKQHATIKADPIQLEQLLINLLKNAHESGSYPENIALELKQTVSDTQILVKDRGKGISEAVMSNALIPFYSTKSSGTGLGLALCREITEAHHGHIGLHNRKGGGLSVSITLPNIQLNHNTAL